ncbi:hypothetical protein BGZ61DRAFT_479668 [Ilyonectria robusta]|uniref:uncharacterized protein n=1 Tax=Ilyonectria robusta TaxID=1079257 RepID=UPI001E8E9CD3|nr:uncharacterized protein BGZ61DRAFT_479668 [Ilyonectria robusta]KAH8686564.1 hypothetical protein BGZ61DRAFT_479668 [Ilyonectria robusta]
MRSGNTRSFKRGFLTRSQTKPIIPVRNPGRELSHLLHPSRSWPLVRSRSTLGTTTLEETAALEKFIDQFFEQPVAVSSQAQVRLHRMKKQRFVRMLYPEDDEHIGYSGDDEFSDCEEYLEVEDDKSSDPADLDSEEGEFVDAPESPQSMEIVDDGYDSSSPDDIDSLNESMSEVQLAESMLNTSSPDRSAPGLNCHVFRVPPKDESMFSSVSTNPPTPDSFQEGCKDKVT